VSDSTGALRHGPATAAEDSVGQAQAIASQLPLAEGARLADAASSAFTDALGIGFGVAAAFALLAAVLVKRRLPNDIPSTRKPTPERRSTWTPTTQPQEGRP
jgi:hypothetical protein